jgi:hypothetical protein
VTRFATPALALIVFALPVNVIAQENPPVVPDCLEFASPNEVGVCICDDGYSLDEQEKRCLLSPCGTHANRPLGRERDPRGCHCEPGFKWEDLGEGGEGGEVGEGGEGVPEEVDDSVIRVNCVAKAACEEPGAVRDVEEECVCPSNSTGDFDTDEEGVVTLVSCECDAGYVFSPAFYTCRASDFQCPVNSHEDPTLVLPPGESDEGGEAGEGREPPRPLGPHDLCRCNDGYHWTRDEETCTLIISDCGPNAHPSPGGEGCECNDGFFPAPQGQNGCVGEELCGRCVSHAHPVELLGEGEGEGEGEGGLPTGLCECECNTGYEAVFEDGKLIICELEYVPPPDVGVGGCDEAAGEGCEEGPPDGGDEGSDPGGCECASTLGSGAAGGAGGGIVAAALFGLVLMRRRN